MPWETVRFFLLYIFDFDFDFDCILFCKKERTEIRLMSALRKPRTEKIDYISQLSSLLFFKSTISSMELSTGKCFKKASCPSKKCTFLYFKLLSWFCRNILFKMCRNDRLWHLDVQSNFIARKEESQETGLLFFNRLTFDSNTFAVKVE